MTVTTKERSKDAENGGTNDVVPKREPPNVSREGSGSGNHPTRSYAAVDLAFTMIKQQSATRVFP
jgi:hypothetical protein